MSEYLSIRPSIRQHTYAYVSIRRIRQHMSAYVAASTQHASIYARRAPHRSSAYVSIRRIRQRMPAYVHLVVRERLLNLSIECRQRVFNLVQHTSSIRQRMSAYVSIRRLRASSQPQH